jgi:hypothetical protein
VAGLEGRKITAEASKAGHEASAKDRDAIARERLQEFIRGNKAQEAHNQATLKQLTESGQDTRELRKQMAADTVFQKDLTKAGEDSVMGFDGGKGLFELGFTGRHTERPEVQQAYLPFETRLKKALGGKVPTAQQKKMARDAWYKEKGWTP